MKLYFRNMSFTSGVRRDLSLVLAAKTVSLLGDEVAALALVLKLQHGGAGTGSVAVLLMAALLPLVMLAPLVGRLVDAVDSRVLLVVSSLAQALLCVFLAFQASTGAILLLVAALGAGQSLNGATWQALLPAIVGPAELPRAMGYNQAAMTVASVASPALAGLLFGMYGARVPLLLDAATFLAITVAGLLVTTRHGRRATSQPAPGRSGGHGADVYGGGQSDAAGSAGSGLRIMRRDPLLRTLLAVLAVFVGLGSMVNVVEVFLIRGTLGASANWYGINGAALALGMLVAALLAGRLRGDMRLAHSFVASTVVIGTMLVAIAAAPNVYVLLPLSAAVGAGNGLLNVTLSALVMGRAAAPVRGRVAAALSAVASGAQLGA
ncbi:MAG: MFS transporter, partial [Jatrophihabitans sp.]